jgi:1,4-alpha-glucan branching enzyme
VIISHQELELFLKAEHKSPHSLLGMHPIHWDGEEKVIVRALLQNTASCSVVATQGKSEKIYPLEKINDLGFYEGIIDRKSIFKYQLRAELGNGEIRQFFDPYSFTPTLSEEDTYLFNNGQDHFIYKKHGAHFRNIDGVEGVSFAVWAPGASRVSVIGNFNHWDARFHPMRMLGSSGVWELFIPGLSEGLKYKFELIGGDKAIHQKTDPYGTYFESPPHNASIIHNVEEYNWSDSKWIEKRGKTNWAKKPISVYEVHIDSWKRKIEDGNRPFSYRELADELVKYLKDMHYTHVEFMPISEYPFLGSWGYQVTGFFAPTHRYGEPEDFKFLVDELHNNDLGVIIDWVPGHFPKDRFALAQFDGTHLYEHQDPRQGEHQDWGTLIFNYGRHEVRGFLIASALAWFDRYHIDGLRVDAVASMLYLDYSRKEGQWIPNKYGGNENLEAIEFMRETNKLVHQYYPGALMIAEESTSYGGVSKPVEEGGLGFDLKWNMGWMNDTLEYFKLDPVFRKWHHNEITFGMIYQYSENFAMVFSHDEVVHGKGSMLLKMAAGSITDKAHSLRSLYALMWAWPGKKTLFMGSDFGQSSEWNYDESLEWHLLQYKDHSGIQAIVRDLNKMYRKEAAFHESDLAPEGFQWRMLDDAENSVIGFIRKDTKEKNFFLVVTNCTPVNRENYRISVPKAGFWKEVINSDANEYGGHGMGNQGGRTTEENPDPGHDNTILVNIPSSSTVIFKYQGKK